MDCTKHSDICTKVGIKGYPSLYWVSSPGVLSKYKGGVDFESLKAFVDLASAGGYDVDSSPYLVTENNTALSDKKKADEKKAKEEAEEKDKRRKIAQQAQRAAEAAAKKAAEKAGVKQEQDKAGTTKNTVESPAGKEENRPYVQYGGVKYYTAEGGAAAGAAAAAGNGGATASAGVANEWSGRIFVYPNTKNRPVRTAARRRVLVCFAEEGRTSHRQLFPTVVSRRPGRTSRDSGR